MKTGLHAFLFLLLSIIHCFGSGIEDYSSSFSFGEEWKLFIAKKAIDLDSLALDHEFALLEEFSVRQLSRLRPPMKGMDRYEEWVPFYENKVSLQDGTEMSASFIYPGSLRGENYQNFIASQSPMAENLHLFWQMVWEKRIDQIVMTTELYEDDGEELCSVYWPQQIGERIILKNGIEVTLMEEKWLLPELQENIQIRKFHVHYEHQDRFVTHYWYHHWPDGTAPNAFRTIFTMIEAVENDKVLSTTPILAHCAAGVGRTGVFIALYHMMQRAEKGDISIPLFEFVANLRWQRPDMVGDLVQYAFCSQAQGLIF